MDEDSDENGFVRWSRDGGKFILSFHDEKTDAPVLSQMAKKFNIEYNIRAGGIQSLQGKKVGKMLIDFIGDENEIQNAIKFLNENGVEVEKDADNN